MENIEKYIQKVKEYIKQNPDITEDILIRYVFLDLGKRLSFDLNYIPFGNSRKRQEIYRNGFYPNMVDKCLENNIVICNSASKLLELILSNFGINIKTIKAKGDIRKYPHYYNIVKTKDNGEYIIDLQEDMYRIKMNGVTPNYGLSLDNEIVISRFDQEQMDKKIGYITDNYYTDEYLYLLKNDMNYIDNFYEKVKFLLENIEIYENDNMNYIDRQWYHVRILEYFFNEKTFDYNSSLGKIKIVDCYKDNKERIYINCIVVEELKNTHIFIYNKTKHKYQEIELKYFVNSVKNGLIMHRNKIQEVEKVLRKKALNNISF